MPSARLLATALALLVGAGGPIAAQPIAGEQRAKTLFETGRRAFDRGDYQSAYDHFREAYLASQEPALLYNMASALMHLRRPHDAAEALSSYLRALPTDSDRPAIEQRIRTLEETQRLYEAGRGEFDRGEFQAAHDHFREAYRLSQEPALLYNMASALTHLRRPHDAAEALRAYLQALPTDPDRPAIEQRVRTLEESQRLLDEERVRQAGAPSVMLLPPGGSATSPAPSSSASQPAGHRSLAIALGAVGAAVVVAGAAIAIGFVASPTDDPITLSSLGATPGTR